MGYPVQLREIRRTPNALTIFSMLTWCYRVAVILPACHAGDPSSTLGSTAKTIVIDKVTSYISVRIRFFPPIWENGVMVNATVLKTVYKTKLYLSVLCLYLIGVLVKWLSFHTVTVEFTGSSPVHTANLVDSSNG